MLASIAQAVVAAALAFTGSLGAAALLTVLLGTANAVSQPAEFALIPSVVTEERLPIANAHVETARFAGFAAGPLLGGILVGIGGTRCRYSSTPPASSPSLLPSPSCANESSGSARRRAARTRTRRDRLPGR